MAVTFHLTKKIYLKKKLFAAVVQPIGFTLTTRILLPDITHLFHHPDVSVCSSPPLVGLDASLTFTWIT